MSPVSHSPISSRLRVFYWASLILLGINLLVVNDYAPIWDPWEGNNWIPALEAPSSLSQYFLTWLFHTFEGQLFVWRLPGLLLLLGAMAIWYYWGKPIFGRATATDTLLVMASSFTLVFCAKLTVNDLWLFTCQLAAFLALIRYLKQGTWRWQLLLYLSILTGLFIHPWSMAIFILVLALFLRLGHSQGKVLDRLYLWVLLPVFFFTTWWQTGFIFTYGSMAYWKYLFWIFAGLLPWTGLLVASLADWQYKLRKKEEMALIVGGFLIAALAAHSLILTVALSLMVARQLSAYFQVNYPYQSTAKGFAILHLLFSFFAITLLLLTAFTQLGAPGFRAAMALGAIYWIMTFAAVIGLYGHQRHLIVGGMCWGGMFTFFMFWIQLFPLIESRQISTSEVVKSAQTLSPDRKRLLVAEKFSEDHPSLKIYADQAGLNLEVIPPTDDVLLRPETNNAVLLTETSGHSFTEAAIEGKEWSQYCWMTADSIHLFMWKLP